MQPGDRHRRRRQQISIALGVAVGGSVLEMAAYFSGHAIGADFFTAAFLAIAVIIGAFGGPAFQAAATAGNAVSGHRLADPDRDSRFDLKRMAEPKMVAFENRSGAYIWVREHRKRRKPPLQAGIT